MCVEEKEEEEEEKKEEGREEKEQEGQVGEIRWMRDCKQSSWVTAQANMYSLYVELLDKYCKVYCVQQVYHWKDFLDISKSLQGLC